MMKGMFSPPQTRLQVTSYEGGIKPLGSRLMANPFQGMASKSFLKSPVPWKNLPLNKGIKGSSQNVGHLIEMELKFQADLNQFDKVILMPCREVDISDRIRFESLLNTVYTLGDKHKCLLNKLKEIPIHTSVSDSRLSDTILKSINAMEPDYRSYCENFVDDYQMLTKLRLQLKVGTEESLEVFMYKPFEMLMTYKKLVQNFQRQDILVNPALNHLDWQPLDKLETLISQSKTEVSAYEQVYQLENDLRSCNNEINLTDQFRRILLRSTFELANLKWLENAPAKKTSVQPARIHCVLLSDKLLVLGSSQTSGKPYQQIILQWDNMKDVTVVQLKPRAGDPFGTCMILSIRKVASFKVYADNPDVKTHWKQWLDTLRTEEIYTPYSTISGMVDKSLVFNNTIQPELDELPMDYPASFLNLLPGNNEFDYLKEDLDKTSSLPDFEKTSVLSPAESLSSQTSSPPSEISFNNILYGRSSSTLDTVSSDHVGVSRFLSKPSHILVNDGTSEVWKSHAVIIDFRKNTHSPSYILGKNHSGKVILRLILHLNWKFFKTTNNQIDLVDQNFTYRILINDPLDIDELYILINEALNPRNSLNSSFGNLDSALDSKPLSVSPSLMERSIVSGSDYRAQSTLLGSVACKLYILNEKDYTWNKIGSSQVEIYQEDFFQSNSRITNSSASSTTTLGPSQGIRLLIKASSEPDAPRRIDFSPGSFRCERQAPTKLLISQLTKKNLTKTILIQFKSKSVTQSFANWLVTNI